MYNLGEMVKQGRPRKNAAPEDLPEKLVGITVRMEESVHERLRKMNYETREPMQSVIRRGIELALKAAKY